MGYESRVADHARDMRLQVASVRSALFGGTPEQKNQFMELGAVPSAKVAANLVGEARMELLKVRGKGLRLPLVGVDFVGIRNGVDGIEQDANFGHVMFESNVETSVDEWESLTSSLGRSIDESSEGRFPSVPHTVMGIEDGNRLMDGVVSSSNDFGIACGSMARRAEDLADKIPDLSEFFDAVDDVRDRSLRGEIVSDRLSKDAVTDLATRARVAGEKLVRAREVFVTSQAGFEDAAERCGKVGEYAKDRSLGREMAEECAEADARRAAREARNEAWDKALEALRNGLASYDPDDGGPDEGKDHEAPEDVPDKGSKDGPDKGPEQPRG